MIPMLIPARIAKFKNSLSTYPVFKDFDEINIIGFIQ